MAEQSQIRLTQAHQEFGIRTETELGIQTVTELHALVRQYQLVGKRQAFGHDMVLYGLDPDGWMQREAVLELLSNSSHHRVSIQIEAHAPHEFYPAVLTFEDDRQHSLHTHVMTAPGGSEVVFTLPSASLRYVKIICDKIFVLCQVHPDSPDTRELGVRLCGVHYA